MNASPVFVRPVRKSTLMMAGMNDVDLARAIRAKRPELPIVLTSGYSEVLAEEGTCGFPLVRKPYCLDDLSKALREAFATQAD